MMKVGKRISGIFRSEEHAAAVRVLRAVLSPAAKQGCDLIDTIVERLWTPRDLGDTLARG